MAIFSHNTWLSAINFTSDRVKDTGVKASNLTVKRTAKGTNQQTNWINVMHYAIYS